MAGPLRNPSISSENVQTLKENVTCLHSDYYILEGQFRTLGNSANEAHFLASNIDGDKIIAIQQEAKTLLATLQAREDATAGSNFNYEPLDLHREADTFRQLTCRYDNLKALATKLRYRLEGPTYYNYDIDDIKYMVIGNQPNPDQTGKPSPKKRHKQHKPFKPIKFAKTSEDDSPKPPTESAASESKDVTFPNLKVGASPGGKIRVTEQDIEGRSTQSKPSHMLLPPSLATSSESLAPLYSGPLVNKFANSFINQHPHSKDLKAAKKKIAQLEAKIEKSSNGGTSEMSISAMAVSFTHDLEAKDKEIVELNAQLERQVKKFRNAEKQILAISNDADAEVNSLKKEIKRLTNTTQDFSAQILELKATITEKDIVIQDRDNRLRNAAAAQLLRMHKEMHDEDAARDLERRRIESIASLDEFTSQKQNLEEQIRDLQVEKGILEKIVAE